MYVLEFGSFFLAQTGELAATDDERAKRTTKVLLEAARSSPLVTRIIDEGMDGPCWTFYVDSDSGERGIATGILGEVMFEVAWPSKNWSPISTDEMPDRLLISTDGAMYAVVAEVDGDPPFEDDFELGRQAQNCLREIYGRLDGYFIQSIGPTPMWPTLYFVHKPNTDKRHLASIGDESLVVHMTDEEANRAEEFIGEAVSFEASWAVVEHYGAMLQRSSFLECDVAISDALNQCFALQKTLWSQRGWSPRQWWSRGSTRHQLRGELSNLYERHTQAAESANMLRREARDSQESFAKCFLLSHCAEYTRTHLKDCLDWDDTHVLQSARFIEDDLRANSLEQLTLTSAISGAIAGALIAGLVQIFA